MISSRTNLSQSPAAHVETAAHQPATGGPATRIAARVLTGLMALVWVFFGVRILSASPDVIDGIVHQLGYPRYIVPVIGVTHLLGGLGLLIPSFPRLTEWVYACLTCDLVLACVSFLFSGHVTSEALHPIILGVFLLATYLLRRRLGPNLWSR